MSKKSSFYRFLSLSLLVGFVCLQATEYYRAKALDFEQEKLWLDSELIYLKSKTREMKREAEILTKIEGLLSKFEKRLGHSPREIAKLILKKSRAYNLDPLLVMGVIKTESSFSRYAVSNKGARGLMQLMAPTGEEVAREIKLAGYETGSLNDGRVNITLGIHYLSKLIGKFENIEFALEAYNRGPNAVRKAIRKGKKLNPKYSKSVLLNYQKFTNEYLSM